MTDVSPPGTSICTRGQGYTNPELSIIEALDHPLLHEPIIDASSADTVRKTVLEFFATVTTNDHTHRAYFIAARSFFRFAATMPDGSRLETLSPLHVSAWLAAMKSEGRAVPTIKARLAAIRHLLQYMAGKGLIRFNPASVVRGPKHSVKRGKTPVLAPDEARQLLDAIDISTLAGLRDRALVATMVYSFARIGAVIGLTVSDVFQQNRRLWVRLREKGGNTLDVPCHHTLEEYLSAYIDAANLRGKLDAPLFQAFAWKPIEKPDGATDEAADEESARAGSHRRRRNAEWTLSGSPLTQPVAWEIIERRTKQAAITTRTCNHTFRATGITAYLKNGGTLERAANIAGHKSTRTTQLYDRRPDDVTLDEIERIQI